ncbi:hypothetical protein D9M71_168830 [compost metagenome]
MFAGNVLETEFVGEMRFQPLLDLQDYQVLVQFLPTEANAPRGVVALHFVERVTGHGLGDVGAAEALDQVDIQIASRRGAASAIQVVGVGQVFVRVERDIRVALAELAEEPPVGGRFLAIEQAGFGQPEDAAGLATEDGATGMLLA